MVTRCKVPGPFFEKNRAVLEGVSWPIRSHLGRRPKVGVFGSWPIWSPEISSCLEGLHLFGGFFGSVGWTKTRRWPASSLSRRMLCRKLEHARRFSPRQRQQQKVLLFLLERNRVCGLCRVTVSNPAPALQRTCWPQMTAIVKTKGEILN